MSNENKLYLIFTVVVVLFCALFIFMPIILKKKRSKKKQLTRGKVAKRLSKSTKRIIDQKTIEYGFNKYHRFVIRKDSTKNSRDDYVSHGYTGGSSSYYIKLSMFDGNGKKILLSFPHKLDFKFINGESRAKITLYDWDMGRDDIYNIKQYGSLLVEMSPKDSTAFCLSFEGSSQDYVPIITASV